MKQRVIAINLPQFHPFPENDKWWGKGFTEWTNVTKAKPLFKGHYQPHLPTDTGFYDLRLEQAREFQAELAKQHGIYGFCYYHYWFNGKRLMHEPLDAILNSKKPDFPFMYCWANENWTKKWDGEENQVLIDQKYSTQDDLDHIRYLLGNVFNDPRYIRVNNKPFFVVYRPGLFPNISETIQTWREEASKWGVELYLGYMQGFNLKVDPKTIGFDAAVSFEPDFYNQVKQVQPLVYNKILNFFARKKSTFQLNRIIEYGDYVDSRINVPQPPYKYYPSITPMWDNTARRKSGAFILKDSSPEIYEKWFRSILTNFKSYSDEENFIFINAWNEWAEGNHLEPCIQWGNSFLEKTKKVIEDYG